MAEDFQGGICGGSWWNPARSHVFMGGSSPCSVMNSGSDVGTYGSWVTDMVDLKVRSCKESNNSVSDDSSIAFQSSKTPQQSTTTDSDNSGGSGSGSVLIDSTLQMMGFGVSSQLSSSDWNQNMLRGRGESYNFMLQEDMNSRLNSSQQQKDWSPKSFTSTTGTEDSTITDFKAINHQDFSLDQQQHGLNHVGTAAAAGNSIATTCQGFSMGSSGSYGGYHLQGLFEPDPQPQQSLFNNRTTSGYGTSLNELSHNWPKLSPLLKTSLPKQHQPNSLHFSNNTPFWNASANSFLSSSQPEILQSFDQEKPSCNNIPSKGNNNSSEEVVKKASSEPAMKRARIETPSPLPTFKVRKEKLGDRITALQQLVSPFGKDDLRSRHEQELKKVRSLLKGVGEGSPEGLKMIDTLQRLGIDFNFQEEIGAILNAHYMIPYSHHQHNLHDLALRFRLLRQEGFHVNPDVFVNFKENKDVLILENDIKSLMALYEASQLCMEGEDIVNEVGDLIAKNLRSCLPSLDKEKSKIVADTLNYPTHKNLARLMVKNFIQNLEFSNDQNLNSFLELAKIEHCMTRTIYQNEILLITKWWKELGLAKELKYARNQPIKWHMWSMAVLTDPSLSEQRLELTKPISLVYIIDDVFDVYGTIDELTLFTEAVNRWDITAAETLPLYMKRTLQALYETTEDISDKIHAKHGWNPFKSLQKWWICLCNAFLVEAKWFNSGKMLNSEEYLKNGIISSGVHVVLVHMFFLLGQGLNKQTVDSVDNFPGIISSTAKILRLSDDLGTAQDEDQEGQDGSYLIHYMKENPDVKIEDAKEEVRRMVSETWKTLNQECLSNGIFSATFRKACLNVARMVPLMYNYNDDENVPDLKELMNCLLCET